MPVLNVRLFVKFTHNKYCWTFKSIFIWTQRSYINSANVRIKKLNIFQRIIQYTAQRVERRIFNCDGFK